MKFAPIVPISYDPAKYTTYHMILAHELMEDEKLFAYYKALGSEHTIILDNGVVERGQPVGVRDLLGLLIEFDKCDADLIIVAPDVIGSDWKTIELTEKFVTELTIHYSINEKKNRHLMVVPQGSSQVQWLYCAKQLAPLLVEGDYIGIPRVTEDWPQGRQHLLIGLRHFDILPQGVNVWLLGIQYKLSEVRWAIRGFREVVGVDSSLPYGAGVQGQRALNVRDYQLINRNEEDHRSDEYDLTDANIVECVRYCNGDPGREEVL